MMVSYRNPGKKVGEINVIEEDRGRR